ncbi:MAG: amino acid ABC transporter permease [Sulfolobales archaeon]|nr:amino acid ABC transporter permease [Sulfolobales archaeon]MCX8198440.1 amino acid ABC transporter permease [Sulfolobales archaeon]MDW8169514.1 amino acid ABC transporter permease [Desulfurococcaceae archaeon]
MSLDKLLDLVNSYGSFLLNGLLISFYLTASSYLIGFALGVLISISRAYGPGFVKALCQAFVELTRGTPMLIQLFLIYYVLPRVDLALDPLPAAIIAIGLNSAAYQSEYLRASMSSISYSQWEAALSIGLTKLQAIREVILPQSIRIAIPTLANELIYLFKYSSVAYFITVPELIYVSKFIGSRTFLYIEVYSIIAVIYVAFSIAATEAFKFIERKTSIPGLRISARL